MAKTKDPNPLAGEGDYSNLEKHRWGVVIADGRQDLFKAIEPLVQLRSKECDAKIECFVVPKDAKVPTPADDPDKGFNFDWCEAWPKYLLLLGGVDEIPFEVQQALVLSKKFVGRLVFPAVQDYGTYATNVADWEDKPCSDVAFVVASGTEGRFLHKNLEASMVSPLKRSLEGEHPFRAIQRVLKRPGQPLPILARVPLDWLRRDFNGDGNSIDWGNDGNLPALTKSLQKAFDTIGKKPARVGLALSRDGNEKVNGELLRDAKTTGGQLSLILGDPAILVGIAGGDALKKQA